MKHLAFASTLLAALWLAGGALAAPFAYDGDGTNGFTAGESFSASNANQIKTGFTNLEAPKYIVQQTDGTLANEQATGLLGTGILFNTTTTGVLSIYGGSTPCTNQFVTAIAGSGATTCTSIATADLPSGATLDTESTVTCLPTKQFFAPEGGETISLYGAPFATTLVRYRAYVLPTSLAETVTVRIQECNAAQQSCAFSDAALTANSDNAAWDTAFSDSAIDADDSVSLLLGTPSGDMSAGSVNIDVCYSRQVVQ